VILGLYQGYYQGKRLRPGDRVICVDAKPSIQARARCHATSPPQRGRPARVEHEYERAGALALLAALDVRTGKVFASCPPTTGIAPFMTLMGQVMSAEPYASASRVFVIVDNGTDHRGTARPFNWTFTAADLARLLQRISTHPEPASLPEAAWQKPWR
jgi:hypothetical protein